MKKITQNLTNIKAWQSMVFAFMFLFSLTINAQEVGQEYLANPGINTATGANSTTPETGVDGGGNFPANLGGWGAATGGAYASASTANGDCHSADRMFKFFKVGGADGQYVNQTITALPAGNYNWSFYTKWGDAGHASGPTGSDSGNLPSWSAEGDNQPKFTILVQDADGAWVADQATVTSEPATVLTWIQDSGTWTNTETRDVRIKFAKNGGTAAAGGSNTDKLMFIDDASLTYASALEATSDCDFSITLTDSYGDSWNGGSVDVSVGGVVVLDDITVSTTDNAGDFATYTFGVNDGDEISVVYTAGSYSYENEYEVFDNSGAVIASSGQGGSTPADSTTTASCIDLTAPAMSVTATTGVASATFSFDISNFTVGAAAGEGDGHIHWSIFAASDLNTPIYEDVMVYSTDDLTLAPLPDGDHVIVFSLVDANHQPLDPAVEATVEFSTFDDSYDCGDTQSYTYESGSGGGSSFATNFTGANEAELAFTVASEGQNVTLVIGGETENNWDWIYVTDEAGTVVYGPATGPQDVTVTTTGSANVYVSADSSVTKTLTFDITCAASTESNLEFKGVIDFSVNQGAVNGDLFGGSDGKAVHFVATGDIADMSIYSVNLYANGNTTIYNSFDFPAGSASAGDEILVARSIDAMNYYMDASTYYTTIIEADGWPTSNGNDALELMSGTEAIDVFGIIGDDPDTSGSGCATDDCWDHEDSWAYKVDGAWTYAAVNTTDGTETICDAGEVYPFVSDLCAGVTSYNVTFSVNTANITVGENGMYAGGGVLGGANAYAMSDDDGDGTWTVTIALNEGTTGNYIFLNSPNSDSDWGTKEDLAGQECADANNFNDRILAAVTADTTLLHCFGNCASDGTCDVATACGVTVSYTQVAGGNYTESVTADAGQTASVTVNGYMEVNYDSLTVTDGAGNVLNTGSTDGAFVDAVYTSTDGTISVTILNDGSVQGNAEYGADVTLAFTCADPTFDVTFSVNTANIEVGPNGMYAGGGVLGDATAYAMSDEDGDGTWTVTVSLLEGTSGNYTFLNSPNDGGDWGAKEDIAGQECADANNYNDRILAEVTADITLLHCFGSCETDGTCGGPAEPILMPIDHENENVVYAWNDFGGAATTVIANPDASGVNTSATVAQSVKTAGSETWAGTFIVLDELLDFSTVTTLAVDVWTPDGGELVNLKVEKDGESYAIEINQPTTVASGWETLYYDLSAEDLSVDYDKLVLFFDFDVAGDDTAYYFDNLRLEAAATVGIDPGCNDFDDGAGEWTVVDAGGLDSDWLIEDTLANGDSGQSFGHGYLPSTAAYNDWLVSPAYNTTGLSAPTLSYYEYLNWSADATAHNVYYSLDYAGDATTATWVLLNDVIGTDAEDTWVQRTFALPSAENVVVSFQYNSTYGADWNIDDVCVQEDTLSTVDSTVLDMRIYPNPSNGSYVTIQTPINGVKYVEVFDITGKRLIDTSLSADTLNVSSMSAGMYLVKVTIEGQSKTSKLIIR